MENKFDRQSGCMDLNASFLRLENPIAQDTLKLIARIGCNGSLNAPPDLNVTFYDGTDANKTLLGKTVISRCLQPGEYIDTGIIITDKTLRGEHIITFVADDDGTGNGQVREPDESDNVKTNVFYLFNQTPQIIGETMPNGMAYQNYSFQVNAIDPDTQIVKYRLMVGEYSIQNEIGIHLTIDSLSGLISAKMWPGIFDLRLQVKDPYGAYTTRGYQLVIENGNNITPVITSQPILTAEENTLYSYQVTATDSDNDPLFYTLEIDNDLQTPPIGMDILPYTGLIKWTPGDFITLRAQPVIVKVSDRRGGIVYQNFTINVEKAINSPPVFQSTPPDSVLQGQLFTYTPRITDLDGDTAYYRLKNAPTGMVINDIGAIVLHLMKLRSECSMPPFVQLIESIPPCNQFRSEL
jgi:hypothetical protein